MIRVDSRQTLSCIARRIMAHNRSRNCIAVLAIVMTTVLFTSVFTAFSSVVKSQQVQEIRMLMNRSHISVTGLSAEKLEQLVSDERVEAYGVNRFLGTAVNSQLVHGGAVLKWADVKGADAVLCMPTKGHMPEKENETAMSSITLDQLGLSHALGTEVHLSYDTGNRRQEGVFILCGIWEGDPLASEQEIWISKGYCRDHAEAEDYAAYLWLDSIFDLYDQEDALAEKYDLASSGAVISANSAYDFFAEDAVRWDLAAAILLIIFLAGYLIIYNVFRISIGSDIRTYGLLKSIGTTGKQLKTVVRRQAMILSLAGIPLGLLLGWLVGRFMTPYLLASGEGNEITEPVYSLHPVVFLAAALFAALTVRVGCQMPARIVSKLSVVEAIRMDFDGGSTGGSKGTSGRTTPVSLALSGFRREWKKACLVVLSLALSITLLNSAYSVAGSYDYDQMLDIYGSYDFEVSGLTDDRRTASLDAVTPELAARLAEQAEVEDVALIYDTDIEHRLDDVGYANLKSILEKAEEAEYVTGYRMEQEWEMLESRQVNAHVMGLNASAFEKMQFVEGDFDYETFSSGDYVIVVDPTHGFGHYYEAGDMVELALPGGKSRNYTVLAIGWMPYDLSYRYGDVTIFDCTYYLPEEAYLELGGSENAMVAGVNVQDGKEEAFDAWLSETAEASERALHIESRLEILQSAQAFAKKHYLILGMLSAVLMIIGILNFYNTTSVSIFARRRELTLLEAVGMTRKQIAAMLSAEGLIYLAAAIVLADTAGMAAVYPLVMEVLGKVFFFEYHVSLLPSLICLPLMAALAVMIPLMHFRKLNRQTVAERLRDV